MNTDKTFPCVTHSKEASILACDLRGETHESLACLAANLAIALRSIAANTCCDTCQEAALVAQSALTMLP